VIHQKQKCKQAFFFFSEKATQRKQHKLHKDMLNYENLGLVSKST